ncbi:MAG TPA: hypothetical protein VEZ11_01540 [Thermoanaerobaculia bacterium]|nr:hypothetical protein [Thermoanaerobaculia bacterium]
MLKKTAKAARDPGTRIAVRTKADVLAEVLLPGPELAVEEEVDAAFDIVTKHPKIPSRRLR